MFKINYYERQLIVNHFDRRDKTVKSDLHIFHKLPAVVSELTKTVG